MLQILYSCRLAHGFILNCGLSLWDKVSPQLSPTTLAKYHLCREGDYRTLNECVSVGNREEKYGGTGGAPKRYWPADFPIAPVFLPSEDPSTLHTATLLGNYSSYSEYFPDESVNVSLRAEFKKEENDASISNITGAEAVVAMSRLSYTEAGVIQAEGELDKSFDEEDEAMVSDVRKEESKSSQGSDPVLIVEDLRASMRVPSFGVPENKAEQEAQAAAFGRIKTNELMMEDDEKVSCACSFGPKGADSCRLV